MHVGLFFCQISIPLVKQRGRFKILSTTAQKGTKDLTLLFFLCSTMKMMDFSFYEYFSNLLLNMQYYKVDTIQLALMTVLFFLIIEISVFRLKNCLMRHIKAKVGLSRFFSNSPCLYIMLVRYFL